jgi:hypothetical protein
VASFVTNRVVSVNRQLELTLLPLVNGNRNLPAILKNTDLENEEGNWKVALRLVLLGG